MVGVQFPAAGAPWIMLRVFAAVAGALEHGGGPLAMVGGLQMLASLAGCAQADSLGRSGGQAERFGAHAISERPYRPCVGCGHR